jgi:hypothetical protein
MSDKISCTGFVEYEKKVAMSIRMCSMEKGKQYTAKSKRESQNWSAVIRLEVLR